MRWLFFLLTSLTFGPALAIKPVLRIADKSTVRLGDPVRLGVIMSGEIKDRELGERLYQLVVFEAITDEGEKVYQSEELAMTLRQKLSFQDLQRVSIKVPDEFKIQARRNFIYMNDIKREITEKARNRCSGCSIEFDDLNLPEIKNKGEILKTRLDTQSLKGAGSFIFPFQIETSQGRGTYWVTGKLSFYKLAPVAKRLLRPNERISAGDFEMKKVDISFAKDGIPDSKSLPGKLAARTLSAGQPIFEGDLKKEPAAQRGQTIRILIGNDSYEITSTGTAEESGHIGDLIRVKSAETQKKLSGILVDQGVVRIQ